MRTKTCKRCHKDRPLSDFNRRSKGTQDGYQSFCRSCTNDAAMRTNSVKYFGVDTISIRKYMIEKQESRCAICGEKKVPLHLDHDHRSGKLRGMLCSNCNRALGLFKDNPEILQSAIGYLSTSV